MFSGLWNSLHIEWPNISWILWHFRGQKAFLTWNRRLDVITLSLHKYRFSKTSVCLKTTIASVFGSSVSEEKKSISFSSREYTVQEADLGNGNDLLGFKVHWSNWSFIPFSHPLFHLSSSFKFFPLSISHFYMACLVFFFALQCSHHYSKTSGIDMFFHEVWVDLVGVFLFSTFYSQASKRDVRIAHLLTSSYLLRDGTRP